MGYPEFLNIRPYMSQSSGEPVVYGLYAVLVHSGYSCHAGHYYCYVKVGGPLTVGGGGCTPASWQGLSRHRQPLQHACQEWPWSAAVLRPRVASARGGSGSETVRSVSSARALGWGSGGAAPGALA